LETFTHHWPVSLMRPAMSTLPSPLKSPTTTLVQSSEPVRSAPHAPHRAVRKVAPLETATHHLPRPDSRPATSTCPPPVKAPTTTLVQWKVAVSGAHVAHSWLVKWLPLEMLTHHWPFSLMRPARSALPSPLKSATCTSTQCNPAFCTAHMPHCVKV